MANMPTALTTDQTLSLHRAIMKTVPKDIADKLPKSIFKDINEELSPALIQNIDFNNIYVSQIGNTIRKIVEIDYWRNPLAQLKKSPIDYGSIIQELVVNPAGGRKFDREGVLALKYENEADVKVMYHQINFEWTFTRIITRQDIERGFHSVGGVNDFINALIESVYMGYNIKEYNMMLGKLKEALAKDWIAKETVTGDIETEAGGKRFLVALKNAYQYMGFPSDKYNRWLKFYQDNGGTDDVIPRITNTIPGNIVIIMTPNVYNNIEVEVLAGAFNLSKVEFQQAIIFVDDLTITTDDGEETFDCIIADRRVFQFRDKYYAVENERNSSGAFNKMYLHIHAMISFSPLFNALAFQVVPEEPEEPPVNPDPEP